MTQENSKQEPQATPFVDRGEPLPKSYAVNLLVAMVRDPEHIFIYWDVDSETRVSGLPLLIRVFCVSDGQSWDMRPSGDVANWYFNVTSNRTYRFELFAVRADGLRPLASSNEVTTPVRCAEESSREVPAELVEAEKHPLTGGRQRRGRWPVPAIDGAPTPQIQPEPSPPPKVVPAPQAGIYIGPFGSSR